MATVAPRLPQDTGLVDTKIDNKIESDDPIVSTLSQYPIHCELAQKYQDYLKNKTSTGDSDSLFNDVTNIFKQIINLKIVIANELAESTLDPFQKAALQSKKMEHFLVRNFLETYGATNDDPTIMKQFIQKTLSVFAANGPEITLILHHANADNLMTKENKSGIENFLLMGLINGFSLQGMQDFMSTVKGKCFSNIAFYLLHHQVEPKKCVELFKSGEINEFSLYVTDMNNNQFAILLNFFPVEHLRKVVFTNFSKEHLSSLLQAKVSPYNIFQAIEFNLFTLAIPRNWIINALKAGYTALEIKKLLNGLSSNDFNTTFEYINILLEAGITREVIDKIIETKLNIQFPISPTFSPELFKIFTVSELNDLKNTPLFEYLYHSPGFPLSKLRECIQHNLHVSTRHFGENATFASEIVKFSQKGFTIKEIAALQLQALQKVLLHQEDLKISKEVLQQLKFTCPKLNQANCSDDYVKINKITQILLPYLRKLTSDQREAFLLKELPNLSYHQIIGLGLNLDLQVVQAKTFSEAHVTLMEQYHYSWPEIADLPYTQIRFLLLQETDRNESIEVQRRANPNAINLEELRQVSFTPGFSLQQTLCEGNKQNNELRKDNKSMWERLTIPCKSN